MTEQQQQATNTQRDNDETTTGWRPEPGDQIVGRVTDIAAADLGYGPYPVVTLQTEAGEIAVHAFHTVLRRELAQRRPKAGDELDIKYLGKKADGGGFGNGYEAYRVRSSGDPKGYDWSRDLPGDTCGGADDVPIEAAPVPEPPAEPVPELGDTNDDDDLPF